MRTVVVSSWRWGSNHTARPSWGGVAESRRRSVAQTPSSVARAARKPGPSPRTAPVEDALSLDRRAAAIELLLARRKALESMRRGGELVARYGGEEFALLLPGADLEDTRRAAERCAQIIADAKIEPLQGIRDEEPHGAAVGRPKGIACAFGARLWLRGRRRQ